MSTTSTSLNSPTPTPTTAPEPCSSQPSPSSPSSYIFFWKTADPYGDFSQWSHSPFTLNTHPFTSAEHHMMYRKAQIMADPSTAHTILSTPHSHPARHKKLGRQIKNFDQKRWDEAGMTVVVLGNLAKFTSTLSLQDLLLSTADKTLVEASPHDRIWGIGFTEEDALRDGNRESWGGNKLGRALMTVRKIIRWRVGSGVGDPFVDTEELRGMPCCEETDWFDASKIGGRGGGAVVE